MHHGTASIFLNQALTFRTFMKVNIRSDGSLHHFLIMVTILAGMINLFALKAGVSRANRTSQHIMFLYQCFFLAFVTCDIGCLMDFLIKYLMAVVGGAEDQITILRHKRRRLKFMIFVQAIRIHNFG